MSEPLNTLRYSGDEKKMAEEAAVFVIRTAMHAVSARGAFSFALSGGASPRQLYRDIACGIQEEPLEENTVGSMPHDCSFSSADRKSLLMPWKSTRIFWSDERCVSPLDDRSNYRMARETLLNCPGPVEKNIFRMPAEKLPAREAALAYERDLCSCFNVENGNLDEGFPVFDLIMLGMGDDGHTASLFPGDTVSLAETSNWVTAVDPPSYANPPVTRLTLTLPVINHARCVLFFITGSDKAALAEAIVSGREKNLPASLVRPKNGCLHWFIAQR
ncbi:MAG: 6-phosphogluconolactonase [Chlorobiaceae bacterium]|nr:6-phosphogluconolactonase [Chlorobiaceae bacterium]NTV59683.1 6-phosphogluconolactonase [Chlorobiaceae bacterium]